MKVSKTKKSVQIQEINKKPPFNNYAKSPYSRNSKFKINNSKNINHSMKDIN
jgi:hypothetical protein